MIISDGLTLIVSLNEQEGKRLMDYAERKDMSLGHVMRQALRVYDMIESVPGAYEAMRELQRKLNKRVRRPCGCLPSQFCKVCY